MYRFATLFPCYECNWFPNAKYDTQAYVKHQLHCHNKETVCSRIVKILFISKTIGHCLNVNRILFNYLFFLFHIFVSKIPIGHLVRKLHVFSSAKYFSVQDKTNKTDNFLFQNSSTCFLIRFLLHGVLAISEINRILAVKTIFIFERVMV